MKKSESKVSESEKNKLKPCPFCGSQVRIKRNMELDGMTFIICELCGAVVSFHGNDSEAQTIFMYNDRRH